MCNFMPVVSVIVPVYNVEKVLHYCIDSILNQTYKDFELILIDDGSPDNSGKICDDYATKDKRINVIHKDNEGVSVARNIGIEKAIGKYICFIDSDDYIQENYLERLIATKNQMQQYKNIWCKFCTVNNYNESLFSKQIKSNIQLYSVKDIMTLHEKWLDAGPVCKLYDREVIIKNNLEFDRNLSLGEDLKFNFDYLDCTNGKIAVLDIVLYNYVHTNAYSLSNKYYEDMLDIYKQLNLMMYKYMKKWNCDGTQFGKFYSACFFKYEVVMKNTFHKECFLTRKEKFKFNNKILKSKEFIDSMNLSSCYIHPLYRFIYMAKNYRIVYFLEKLINIFK